MFLYQWFICLHIFAFIIGICPMECFNLCMSQDRQRCCAKWCYAPPCIGQVQEGLCQKWCPGKSLSLAFYSREANFYEQDINV